MSLTTATTLTINIGSQSNDGTGDNIRDAFDKVNTNFYNITATNLAPLVDFYNSASYLLSVLTTTTSVTKQYVDDSTSTAYTLAVSTSKAYVDNLVGLITDHYISDSGGIMTGTLTFEGAAPQIALNSSTANWIKLGGQKGIGAPTFNTHSTGTKLVLWDNVGVADTGLALGVEPGYMWFNVSNYSNGFKWYAGTTEIMSLGGNGVLYANPLSAVTATITSNAQSVSTITGALTVSGGTGIGKDVYVGGDVHVGGTVYSSNAFPPGGIILWHGSIASIPTGWYLCDGSNGTPDLRDRFIVGASSDQGSTATTTITGGHTITGGSQDAVVVSHTHGITDPGHHHSIQITDISDSGNGIPHRLIYGSSGINTDSTVTNITINTAGVSGTNANLPPYYALAYIMKA
jgi:hypothetical protein